jgi:lycopene beta-cyclase
MDHIFLTVLGTYPLLGPELFMKLFARVPTPKLIRFLTDKGTLLDYAAVVGALPKLLFLKVCFKLIFQ